MNAIDRFPPRAAEPRPPFAAAAGREPLPIAQASSADLLRGARKLMIDHEGEVYTLHLTRQNKLLLTK
ncbi:MAG: hemin uptake protein HemP [Rubrimonas sp.]